MPRRIEVPRLSMVRRGQLFWEFVVSWRLDFKKKFLSLSSIAFDGRPCVCRPVEQVNNLLNRKTILSKLSHTFLYDVDLALLPLRAYYPSYLFADRPPRFAELKAPAI